MRDNHDDPNEALSHDMYSVPDEDTTNYLTIDETYERDRASARELASKAPDPSAKSNPPGKIKRPPRFGRLQKGYEANERDFISTIGSFVSKVTGRVMDRIKRRTLDTEGQPIGRRLKKGVDRFPRHTDSEDERNVEPSSTVYSPVKVPTPSTLNTELNAPPHENTSKQAPNRVIRKPPPATTSPASSIHLPDFPGPPDKETGRRLSHDSIRSPSSRVRRRTPSPHTTPLSRTHNLSSHMTSAPKIDTEIHAEPVDWGAALSQARESPPSEAGSYISGTTLMSSQREGSVWSACDHRPDPPQDSAASINGLQRGISGASTVSGTTAGSVDFWESNEKPLEKATGPQFILTTHSRESDITQNTPYWWGLYDKGEKEYSRYPTDNAPYTKNYQFVHPSLDHSARTGRSEAMA